MKIELTDVEAWLIRNMIDRIHGTKLSDEFESELMSLYAKTFGEEKHG